MFYFRRFDRRPGRAGRRCVPTAPNSPPRRIPRMRLGLMVGYWMPDPWDPTELVLEAERLGYDSAWTAEAYGSDVFSPLCWIGARTSRIKLGTAIMQISART